MAEKTKKIEMSLEQPKKEDKKAKPKKDKKEDADFTHANQYLLDPRQELCWSYYVDPVSETFSNGFESAVKAGYSKKTARHITKEIWWHERTRRLGMVAKAEEVLNDTLNIPHIVPAMGPFGPILGKDKKPILTLSPVLLRIKQDSAKFIAETQGKRLGYTKRTDVDLKSDGKPLSIFNDAQLQTIARGLLNGGPAIPA